MKPSAKVVLDSISPDGVRVTTFEFIFHRTELAELNTHRMLSGSAASSRAIPISKMIARVKSDPAMPMKWGKNQSGMQSYELLDDESAGSCERAILDHMMDAINLVEYLELRGLHKQFSNRYIEPWMTCVKIVTAVEWANFFHKRTHHAAHPNFNALALAVEEAYFDSKPKELKYGRWHLPYITEKDWSDAEDLLLYPKSNLFATDIMKAVSAARCARVSYLNHDGTRPILAKDYELFEKLRDSDPMHPSPLEHVCEPCNHMNEINAYNDFLSKTTDADLKVICKQSGNLPGYHQFRKEFSRENVTEYVPRTRESKE